MGTETRIGIVTGLVIVVVASVYFFYGNDAPDNDVLTSASPGVFDRPKIPAGEDHAGSDALANADRRDKPRGSAAGRERPGHGRRTTRTDPKATDPATHGVPPQRPGDPAPVKRFAHGATGRETGLPVTGANRTRPQAGPSVADRPPSRRRPAIVGARLGRADRKPPRAQTDGAETANNRHRSAPATKNKQDDVVPGRRAALADRHRVADDTSRGSPGRSPTQHGATPLRSGPATQLVEATRDNLERNAAQPRAERRSTQDRADSRRETSSGQAPKPTAPAPSEWPKKHTVSPGDTLSELAIAYYGTSGRLPLILQANPQIKTANDLDVGNVITMPAPPRAERAEATGTTPRQSAARTYQVRNGDTFYSIAQSQCGSSAQWREIFTLNKSLVKNDPKRLRPGMVLKLP